MNKYGNNKTMKKTVKINFCNFYNGFNPEENFLTNALKKNYEVEISEKPDFLFCSIFGNENLKGDDSVKIQYIGENVSPDFNFYDYAIGCDYITFEDRYLRFPVGAENINEDFLKSRAKLPKELAERKFCNFVYHNTTFGLNSQIRIQFCKLLSFYKTVDCPGAALNNMQGDIVGRFDADWFNSKLRFISNYKFTIAFENSSSPGYVTEKLINAFSAKSIPIYYGDPVITREFNPKAFINCHDYESFNEAINKVKELDNNDELYMEMLRQNPMQPGCGFNRMDQLASFLSNIVEKGKVKLNKIQYDIVIA